MKITVDLLIKSKKWQNLPKIEQKIKNIIKNLIPLSPLAKINDKNLNLELTILLVASRTMKNLNSQHRGKNYATDVLSFPAQQIKDGKVKNLQIFDNYLFLGDIICCFETIQKEATQQNKDFDSHLTHLILHSILHLIGFDHEEIKAAKKMEDLEIEILEKLGIKNPYLI